MALHRYHVQKGGAIYPTVMVGGNLRRYTTPVVTVQRGSGLEERLMKIAGPSVVQAAQRTLRDVQRGKSVAQAGQKHMKQLRKNLKRKAPRMVVAVGKHKASQQYKKVKRRIKDIFSL